VALKQGSSPLEQAVRLQLLGLEAMEQDSKQHSPNQTGPERLGSSPTINAEQEAEEEGSKKRQL